MVNQPQQQIVKQIVLGYLALILLTIILYVLGGLIDDELSSILTTLAALSSLYVAPLFQLFNQVVTDPPPTTTDHRILNNPLLRLSNYFIPVHFLIVGALILIKSLNLVSFKEMNLFLGFIETTFGTYVGHLLVTMFRLEKHEN